MDQKFDGTPRAELRLAGRKITRGDLTFDWGLQLRWVVRRNGQVVATVPAPRTETSYEHPDKTTGTYEVVLEMWKYVDYAKKPDGEFVNSKFVEVSNKVTYTV